MICSILETKDSFSPASYPKKPTRISSLQFRREPIQKEIVKKPNLDTNSHAALNATSSPPWRPHPSGKRHQRQSASTTPDSSLRNAVQSRLFSQKRTQTTPDSLRSTSDLLSPPSPSAPPPPINSTMVNDFPWVCEYRVVLPPDDYPASDSDTSSRVGAEFPPPGMIGVDQHGNLRMDRQTFESLTMACDTDDDDDSVASEDSVGDSNRRFRLLSPPVRRTLPSRTHSNSNNITPDPAPASTHPMSTRSSTCINPKPPKPANKTSPPTGGGPATRTHSRSMDTVSTHPKTTPADKQPRRA